MILLGIGENIRVHPEEFPGARLAVHGHIHAVDGVNFQVHLVGLGHQGGEDDRTGLGIKRVVGHVGVTGRREHSARQPLDNPIGLYTATGRNASEAVLQVKACVHLLGWGVGGVGGAKTAQNGCVMPQLLLAY